MKMDKKTIAFILIGVGALAAIYYFFMRNKGGNAENLGSGSPDNRGTWAADDDTTYTAMRSKFSAAYNSDLGWVDPLVKARYEGTDGVSVERVRFIKGQRTKAGAFLSVFEEANPNDKGSFTRSDGVKVLWPSTLHQDLWNTYNDLQIRHGGL